MFVSNACNLTSGSSTKRNSTDTQSRYILPINNKTGIAMLENQVISAIVTRQGEIYTATCPELGTVEQGATEAEAIVNLRILNRVYSSIVLPEINLRSVHFDIVNKTTEIPPDFPPIEISAWRAVRLLENMGFNRVRGLMIMQKNSFDTTNTCIIPLHHRILKTATLLAISQQAQILPQDVAMNL